MKIFTQIPTSTNSQRLQESYRLLTTGSQAKSILNHTNMKKSTSLVKTLTYFLVVFLVLIAINIKAQLNIDWQHKAQITIESTYIDENLTNWTLVFDQSFSAALTQDNGPLDADGTRPSKASGEDIRFTSDAEGSNELAFDIRDWTTNNNPSSATCEVAVKIPVVSKDDPTTIYMWWGNAVATPYAAGDPFGQYNAYDNNTIACWTDGGGTSQRKSASYTSTGSGGVTQGGVTGKIGKATHYDGSDDHYALSGNPIGSKRAYTIEFLANSPYPSLDVGEVIYQEVPSSHSDPTIASLFNYNVGGTLSTFQAVIDDAVSGILEIVDGTPSASTWYHWACTFDGSDDAELFRNAVSKASNTQSIGALSNTDKSTIGAKYTGSYDEHYDGLLDELRISSIVRSDAWLKANYHNQFNSAGFLTFCSLLPDNSFTLSDPTICTGETATITQSGSEVGVDYQLRIEGSNVPVGNPITGTGLAITFDVTPGSTTVYNVFATNATTSCEAELIDKSTVSLNELPEVTIAYGLPNPNPQFFEMEVTNSVFNPYSNYAADIDNDGDLDVVNAAQGFHDINWYENDGTGVFGPANLVSNSVFGPADIVVSDLDGDNHLDIISASEHDDKIAWYKNDGLGNFGPQQLISTSADGAYSVFVADMDGDGDQDVLSASYNDDKVAWYENTDGLGSYGPQQVISNIADGARSVYAADLDNDGDMDVISASYNDDKLAWYENDGNANPNFGSEIIISTSLDGAFNVIVADLNGDNHQDVVCAAWRGHKVVWFQNDGSASFPTGEQLISDAISYPRNIFASDLDNDGDQDVLCASEGDSKISWFTNNGTGSFGSINVISSAIDGALHTFAADLDNDGDKDVLSAGYYETSIQWYQSNLLKPACEGSAINFNEVAGDATSWTWSSSDPVDISYVPDNLSQSPLISGIEDGDIITVTVEDANTCTNSDNVTIYTDPAPDDSFSLSDETSCSGEMVEIIMSSSEVGISYQLRDDSNDSPVGATENGTGSPISFFVSPTSSIQYNILASNILSDCSSELIDKSIITVLPLPTVSFNLLSDVCSSTPAFDLNQGDPVGGIYTGKGITSSPEFDPAIAGAGKHILTYTYTGGNGCSDFARTTINVNEPKVQILHGTPNNPISFSETNIATTAAAPELSQTADLDGDGDQDMVYSIFSSDRIVWIENDGTGNFVGGEKLISTLADGPSSLFSADLDNDGDIDVMSASFLDKKIAWYENDGLGNFGVQQIISSSVNSANFVYASDLDSDGYLDVLSISLINDEIAWYKNDGSANFGTQRIISTTADGAINVHGADLDDDGDIDVLSSSIGDDKIAWYENTDGMGTFGAEQIITTLADRARYVFSADLNNDGSMDVLSASAEDNKIAWYENDGNGVFGVQQIISSNAMEAYMVRAADMDADGDMDVISASYDDDKIAWYENDGTGNFVLENIVSSSANGANSVYASDLDNDGDLDLISSSDLDKKVNGYESNLLEAPCEGDIQFNEVGGDATSWTWTSSNPAVSFAPENTDQNPLVSNIADGDEITVEVSNGTCTNTSSATLYINPLPDNTLAVSDPTVCAGEDATITVSNSVAGVSYQLRLDSDDSNVGAAIPGTGGDIDFILSAPAASAVYNVLATNDATGCEAELTDLANLTVNPLPTVTFGGFAYSLPITIPAANVDGPDDLVDFPLLVSVVLDKTHVEDPNGYDILFTDANGAALDYERESYNATTGELLAWVRIPNLSTNTDTEIQVLYGNPAISTDQTNPTDVWSTRYSGVWHFENSLNDATIHGIDGTNVGTTTTAGQIGQARNYVTGQYITLPDNNTVGFNVDQFVFSAWIQIPDLTNQHPYMWIGNTGPVVENAFYATAVNSTEIPRLFVRDLVDLYNFSANNPISINDWHYIVSIVDFSAATDNISIYVDGVFDGSTTIELSPDYTSGLPYERMRFGTDPLASLFFFQGIGDEFRALRSSVSAGWIKTEFDNQLDPAAFINIGAETVNAQLPEVCINDAPIILEGGTPAGGMYSGTGVSFTGTDYIFDPAVTGAGTFTLTYTYTDANTCSNSATSDITVVPASAPPAVTNVVACEGTFIADLTATGTNIIWYDDVALTNQVGVGNSFNPLVSAPGEYTYYATQATNGGCESMGTLATLTINDSPEPPASSGDITECEADPVQTLDANDALSSTTGVTWYDASSGGSVVATPTLNAVGSVTYYAEFNDGTCSSLTRTAVVLTINDSPEPPASSGDITECEADPVQTLDANDALSSTTGVTWYDAAVGGAAVASPTLNAVGSVTYYAEFNDGTCSSLTRTAVVLTINDSPEPPASSGDITECEADPVQTLDANDALSSTTGVTWYDAAVGGAAVASPTLNAVGSVTYYAEFNDGTCSSLTRTAVVLTINDSPEPPASSGDITECEADPVQTLDANDALSSTTGVTWYDAAVGGNVVATPTLNAVGSVTYYAEFNDGTCSSLTRTAVVLTINDSPEPPASNGDITECEADPVQTLDANNALSSTTGVTWYDAAVGGSVVATPTLNSVGSVTYYAEFNDGTCSSLTRTAVVLTINDSPEPPASSGDITECEADPVQTLDANDALSSTTGVTWYDAAVGGAAVASPTLNSVGSVTYYAEFNDGTCSSLTRTAVVLTINDSPEPPASSGDITECEADPVQTLDANDALSSTTGVTWYDAAVGGAAVASPTLNAVGSVTYYAEFNDGTCSSLTRTAVVLTINDSPEPPTSTGDITECEASPIQTLDANDALSSTTGVTWYDAAVGGAAVASPTLNAVGSVTYYAEFNDGTCSSLTRTAVVLTINDSPEPPASNGDITECEADPVQTLDANDALSSTTGVTWYDAAVGGSVVATPTLNTVGSVTYYAEYSDGTCSSLTRTSVKLTITDDPSPPASTGDITECEQSPIQTLDANNALVSTVNVTWYDAAVGGAIVASPTLNAVGSVTYYAEFNDGICSSLTRTAVILTINDSPEPPASSGDITECEADPVQTLDANDALSSTTGVTWYDAAVGGSVVATPTLNTVGSVTYYAEYSDGTCSSLTRTSVKLTITDDPSPPASTGDITECEQSPIQTLDANNALVSTVNVTWYDAAVGGAIVASPTLNAVGSVTYYAEFNDGICSSLTRTAVVLTINDSPEPPASNGDITECEADPVQTLDANDALSSTTGVTWYDASSGGSVVATPTFNSVGSVTYYAEYNDGTCSSLTRTAVVLTINDSPEPPASSGDITECEADPVQTLDANDALSSTTGVTWYDASSGGSVVATPTLNSVGSVTYYAEFSDGTCSSLSRTAVVLTINDSPEPPTSTGDITECEASPIQTLDANDALSSTTGVTWYDAAVGGAAVASPTLNAVGSVTYYAEFNDGTCSSLTRTAVVLTINDSPEPPASNGDITECEADPVQTLDANDALSSTTGVTWYDASSGGSVVATPTLNSVGSVTYYAEFSDGTCSSLSRTAVVLTINDSPEPPTSTGDITECEASPIQTLDANDALSSTTGVTWYDAAVGGAAVASPTLNAVGSVTYYAEFNDGTCSSLTRTAVVLTINDSPEPPASNGDITECEADPVQTLDANDALSSTTGVTWYDAAVGGSVVATPTLNTVGSVTYYAEYSDGTCSSLTRTSVKLTITDDPSPPASTGDITECEQSPIQTLDANNALVSTVNVTWYDAAVGGAIVASPTLNAVGSVTYYAEFNDGICSSLTRTAVILTINDSPEPPASSGDITECEADPVQTLDANDALSSTTGVTWYDAAVGGSVVATPTLNTVGSVTYYAEYSDGTCSSLTRTSVKLTITDDPSPPASTGDITECEQSPIQTLDANNALVSTVNVTWYDAAVGGAIVASPTLNAVGSVTYYAEFNDGICSSLTRTAVVLTINDSPEPPASNGDITECEADPVQTLDANDALSSTTGVTWYDASSGGSVVATPTFNSVGSVTYYAEYNDGTCSSLTRTAVVLTINDSPEPPASSGDITECEADPVQTLDANDALSSTTGVTWYDASSGGSVVATPTLNSVGSVTYYAEFSDGTCSSLSRTAVVLTINDSPEPPTSTGDITECEASPIQTLDANDALSSTTGVTWYDAAVGGAAVASPTLNAVGSVTYYAEFNDGTCSSLTRTAVVLTINDSPEPPASNGDITECEADPVQTLDANDALSSTTGVIWYDAAVGGNVVATPTLNSVGSVTYYAEFSDGTCSSLTRTAVVLTINDSPEPPASNGDITECEADPVQTLDANDALSSTTGVTWYDAAVGGAIVASPTLNSVGSVTYYAEYNDGTCSSLTRTAVVLTINDSPEPPASNGDITECEADPVQTLDANNALSSTTGVTWYDASSGGSVVATPTLNSVGSVTYYAEYNDGTCSSLTRTAVVLTINDSPEPPASSGDITECEADPVQTLDANDALSSTTGVTWYDASSGGSVVATPTLNSVGSVTYYAEFSDGTCSSLSRTAVVLTINDSPEPPTSTGDITECEASPIQTLDANDALSSTTGVTWYDAAVGGAAVASPTLNAVGSVTYYAEFNDGTCSSLTRTAVVLTINDSPEPPASNGDITECEADPVQTLDANDALSSTTGVTWYDAAVGGSVVATPTLNTVGSVTYYAEYSDGTCSSLTRTSVKLTITDDPSPPASTGDITECEQSPIQTLDANNALVSTVNVTWYDAAVGGAIVASPTLNAVGSVTYYAEFNDGICSSLTRTAVILTINDSPEPPASSGDITECEADPVQTLDANDALSSTTGVTWYDAAVGGSVVATPTLNTVGSVTYYAEYSDGTCSSLTRTSVKLTITDDPSPPASTGDITECEQSPIQTLDANNALVSTVNVTWYDAAVGGAIVASPTLNAVGSVTYYAEFNDGICSSLTRTAVVLTINDSPEPPASNGDITECEADPVQTLDANDALSSTTGVTWYDASSGGSVVATPTFNSVGSVTYYAEYNDGTCSSLTRTAVVLTINDSPEPPASSGDITECEADPVQTLDANDALSSTTGVTWYDASSGGSVVATPTLNSVGSVTYYAEFSDGTCSSLSRTAVVLTINDSPEPPTSTGDITECEASPIQTLDANDALSSTTGVTWYDAAVGGAAVASPTLNAVGSVTYYAEFNDGTCSSLTRTAVVLTINDSPEPPASNGDITECEADPVQTLDANDALSSTTGVTWYDAAVGGSVVATPTLNTVGSVTYYAEYSDGTCSSLTRTSVKLTITDDPSPPASTGDITECEQSPIQTLDANNALVSTVNVTWYDAAVGGAIVASPTLNAVGSVTYYAEFNDGICSSLTRTAVILTINDSPEPPASSGDITECEADPVQTLDANDALSSTTGVTWYDAAVGGSVVATPTLNTVGSVTYYAEYSDGTCSSLTRTSVKLTITDDPSPPASTGDITECEQSPIQTLDANNALVSTVNVTWYDAAVGGAIVASPTLNAVGSVTYYAEFNDGICSSLTRTAVILTINDSPEPPASSGDITECEADPVQTLDANDALSSTTGVTWYDAAVGGNVVATPTLNSVGSVTYYAEFNDGTCSSLTRTAVVLTINDSPEPPASNGDITECEADPVQTLDANDALSSTTGVTWYDAAVGGAAVASPTLNAVGSVTYYAEFNDGTCSSLTRTAVVLTINDSPEPPASNGDIIECEADPVQTLDANNALSSTTGVTWYDAAVGGAIVASPTLNSVGSVTYYAEYNDGTCSSLTRTAVVLTINDSPEPPASNGDIIECEADPVQTLDANNALSSTTGVTWYDAAVGGAIVASPTLNSVGSVTYYAEYNDGTCSSLTRTAVVLTINDSPEPPASNGDIIECEADPVQTLDANNALSSTTGVTWYDAAVGGAIVASPTLNSVGSVTYYAEYNDGTCSSLTRTAVVLTINDSPEPPASNGDIIECEADPIQTLDANDALSSTVGVTWYDAAVGGAAVASPTLNAVGSVTYYAEFNDGTCSSLTRTAVVLTINDSPEPPASSGDITECEADPIQTLDANDALSSTVGVTWYDASSGGSVVTTPTLNSVGSVTYYAEFNDGTCSSLTRTAVVLTINEIPVIESVAITDVSGCHGDLTGSICISATGGTPEYEYSIDGNEWSNENCFENLGAGSYTVVVRDANGCITSLDVEISEPPLLTLLDVSIQDVETCNGDASGGMIVTATGGTGILTYTITSGSTSYTNNDGVFTNLPAGFYQVGVEDENGCESSFDILFEIDEPPSISITNVSVTDVSTCSYNTNGSIEISADGGTGDLMYSIFGEEGPYQSNPTFTDLGVGAYIIWVMDANGCMVEYDNNPVIVGGPDAIVISDVFVTDVSGCNGNSNGSIIIVAGGGTGALTYSIFGEEGPYQSNPEFTDLGAGAYDIWIEDANGCRVTYEDNPVVVGEPPAIDITEVDVSDIVCYGSTDGTILITAEGGTGALEYSISGNNPDTYQSNPEFTDLGAGAYEIWVGDANGCTTEFADNPVVIDEWDEIIVSEVIAESIGCNGELGRIEILASGGSGTLEYSINNGENYQLSNLFTNLQSDTYIVRVRYVGIGCFVYSPDNPVVISDYTPMQASITKQDVFPCNGDANGSILVNATGGFGSKTYILNGFAQSDPLFTDLPAGTYELVIEDERVCTYVYPELIEITEPDALLINEVTHYLDGLGCFGHSEGVIEINAEGGNGILSYSIDGEEYLSNGGLFTGLTGGTYEVSVRDENGCEIAYTDNPIEIFENTEIVYNSVVYEDVTECFGNENGLISIDAAGGTGELEYSIDGGTSWLSDGEISGLGIGSYQIVIRDALGCERYYEGNPVVLTGPDPLEIESVIAFNASCYQSNDGSIVISSPDAVLYSIDGGDSWQESSLFVGLAAGDYQVAIQDESGCIFYYEEIVSIQEPGEILIEDVLVTDVSCDGSLGVIDIRLASNPSQMRYSIDGGITFSDEALFEGLLAGEYTIVVSSGFECNVPFEGNPVTVGDANEFAIEITVNGGEVACTMSEVILEAEAEGATQYNWSTGDEGSVITVQSNTAGPQSYWCEVVRGDGCVNTDTVVVDYKATPDVRIEQENEQVAYCVQQEVSLVATSSTDGVSYYWPASGISGAENTVSSNEVGFFDYIVEAENEFQCIARDTVTLEFDVCESGPTSIDIELYPSPTDGPFTLRINGAREKMDIFIYDIRGREVRSLIIKNNERTILELQFDLSQELSGVYYVWVSQAGIQSAVKEVVLID
jgi:hypothetical protein